MSMFSLKFEVSAEAKPGISTTWQAQVKSLEPIKIAIPPEFHGPGGGYSPEDLYGLSVLNCLIALFKDLAERNSVIFEKIEGKLLVTMDKDPQTNGLILTHLDITFNIIGAADKEKTRTFLEKAIAQCPVTNSIKSGKTCHININ